MTRLLSFCVLYILYLQNVKAARILAVVPTPAISHQVAFRPLILELVKRGHSVTYITTDPIFPAGHAPKNLTEINLHDESYQVWHDEFFKPGITKKDDIVTQVHVVFKAMMEVILSQLQAKEVQKIIKNEKYDLLMIEAFAQPAIIFSHFFKVPVILISSFSGMTFNYRAVGAPRHAILYPTMYYQKLYNLTRWDKLYQIYRHWFVENAILELEYESDVRLKELYGSETPTLQDLASNIHLLFLNINPIWVDNQPVPPNVIYFGGMHVPPRKELPKDVQDYLDSSKNGVIYFSLGTNVKTEALPAEAIRIFIKVFSELPYNILWKWDIDELPGQAENIRISKWLPQSDLLRHPNVKLFITQGGLQSTDEALSAGVPLIGIPMLGDQWFNVQKYVRHKIGLQLNMLTLTEEDLRSSITRVIEDKSFRENVVKLRKLVADQPQTPLERAVWWTEYVIRHGGAEHLRAAAANLTWSEFLELELVFIVLSALLVGVTVILGSLYMLWKFVNGKVKVNIKKKVR